MLHEGILNLMDSEGLPWLENKMGSSSTIWRIEHQVKKNQVALLQGKKKTRSLQFQALNKRKNKKTIIVFLSKL